MFPTVCCSFLRFKVSKLRSGDSEIIFYQGAERAGIFSSSTAVPYWCDLIFVSNPQVFPAGRAGLSFLLLSTGDETMPAAESMLSGKAGDLRR